jgi:hypothetical protein
LVVARAAGAQAAGMTATQQHTVIHTIGSKVWLRDEAEGWVRGEVIKLEGDSLVVELEDVKGTRRVPQDQAPLQNNDSRGVEVRARARAGRGACVRAPLPLLRRCCCCCCCAARRSAAGAGGGRARQGGAAPAPRPRSARA